MFILQYLPNGLIYILAGYIFAKRPINKREYWFSSMILAVFGLVAKVFSEVELGSSSNSLPQILIIFACVFLLVYRNKISIMHSIISSLTVMMLQLIFELVYMVFILQGIFKVNIDLLFSQSSPMFSLIGLPYLLTLGLFVLLVYKVIMKRRDE